jgi:diadenosine tetraphosphatase ApaH/serine/threonine PP2A family protein phosphatase
MAVMDSAADIKLLIDICTQGVFVWRRINELFNYLPLAATIENKILCMHGGIGRSINKVGLAVH